MILTIIADCTWLNKDGARDGTDKLLHNEAAAMQIHMEVGTFFLPSPSHIISPSPSPS